MRIEFRDKVTTDGKTLISCRDGVQEYLGVEIDSNGEMGLDSGAVFKVYRKPETIRQLDLVGVPITNDHVSMDEPYKALGSIVSNKCVDSVDNSVNKTIQIENTVKICDSSLQRAIESGKNELSLGYMSRVKDVRDDKDTDYDFRQDDIIPHHLAVVDKGRCGDSCKFKDGEKLNMEIKDYQGAKEAIGIVSALMPTLDAEETENLKARMAKAGKKEETDEEIEARKKKEADAEAEAKKKKEADVAEGVKKGVADYAKVIAKANELGCLDSDYSFADKTKEEIMKDCIATQSKDEFADSELSAAFKMLRKVENPHKDFGDGSDVFLKDEEIK
jgi:hypothetical protein